MAAPAPIETLMSVDANFATAHVAFAMSNNAFLYPITPSSPMGEHVDAWVAQNRKNIFGEVPEVFQMQSEGGAAAAVHGAAVTGSLVSTYTASQGLLLMIPNLFKIAGELLPVVFHVTARSVAGQALCIFGDHSDVMACRTTGMCMMSSHSVQEAHDFAVVAHITAIKSSVPVIHFFDGFRTSHEIQKVRLASYDAIKELAPMKEIREAREKGLNPKKPSLRGTSQGSDVYFQNCERVNPFYEAIPAIMEKALADFAAKFGRKYGLFDFYGAADAERIVVLMGAGAPICEEAADYLMARNEKVGVLKVHLFRPWSVKHFISLVPKTTKFITVLERTKEPGALGEPLYLDVCSTFQESRTLFPTAPIIVAGRYGLGSKDFTPAMAKAVFDNMLTAAPMNHFTVGINDDVTFKSLPLGPEFDSVPAGTTQCMFWGLGSDGTVGANHDAIKIIGDNTDMFVQGYFAYDAHKSGGVTISHLRFGKKPIKSQYLIQLADYVACHFTSYVFRYGLLDSLRENGTFVLNTPWKGADLEAILPSNIKRAIALKKAKFYTVDAQEIAAAVGLGRRINMVMQAIFFKLSGVLPFEKAIELLKKAIAKTYGSKGQKIVDMNVKAVDQATEKMQEIKYPASWATESAERTKAPVQKRPAPDFVTKQLWPQLAMEGNSLPVSVFQPGGVNPMGTTKYEKRAIATSVPVWDSDKCMQCNECSLYCPHAAIRPFVLTEEEKAKAPFPCIPAKDAPNHYFRIQVSTYDCASCEVCSNACVYGALKMKPWSKEAEKEAENWEYAYALPNKGYLFPRTTLIGSQFQQPLLEFSGACEGCNETGYVKLATQLFGERMLIANATGCSSIWGGTWGTIPYTTNAKGHGPAWGNSLFEDAAEYGVGMAKSTAASRLRLKGLVAAALKDEKTPADVKAILAKWDAKWTDVVVCEEVFAEILPLLEKNKEQLAELYSHRNFFPRVSQWIVGGDGWAYDIDYGGLDHVIASGVDLNVLVLDTEMYSNTGGQKSKSTPIGAVAKFATNGCRRNKKDLGAMAMAYGDVYVASISLQANPQQALQALIDAESYNGASLVLCYCPCREQGFPLSQSLAEARAAVETGYWNLYRFDPRLTAQGKNPFQLDATSISVDLKTFLSRENRYESLMRTKKEVATELQATLKTSISTKMARLQKLAADTGKLQEGLKTAAPKSVNQRTPIPVRPAAERAKDFKEVSLGYTKESAIEESKRCLQCKAPRCQEGCPAGLRIPAYIKEIQNGDFAKALGIILEASPLPSVCGRVCPHPCEAKCVRGLKGEPIAIDALKRAAADFAGAAATLKVAAATGKKVAVVGSGPAGLTAAFFLAQLGHKVVVFESKAVAGGMMALTIPSYRLPREALAADVNRVIGLGVELKLNTPVKDVASLLKEYNAVFVGVGSNKPKFLAVDGADLKNVEHVLPFLEAVNTGARTFVGKKVAVIGAGFSAFDAARVSKRLGAEEVSIIYRRDRKQVPAAAEEVKEAEEEGVKLVFLAEPVKFVGTNGAVSGVVCQKQTLGAPDASGRPAPVAVAGSEFTVVADHVIEAISQDVDAADLKVAVVKTGIEVDASFATSVKGVFAAGDAVTGPKDIVSTVAATKKAVAFIDAFLKN